MWLENKYISLLSNQLPGLVNKGHDTWNFRCVFCGDSKKSAAKARGYILRDGQDFYSYCHNCHTNLTFRKFLERLSPHLYDQYIAEKLTEKQVEYIKEPLKSVELETDKLLKCARISLLPDEHPAKKYLIERLIPRKFYSKLYYTEDYNKYANTFIPDKYPLDIKEPRIIIPMINSSNKLIGFQGRSLKSVKDNLRYITLMLSPNNPRLFGLANIDFNKTNYIFEGPFDSLFIPNSLSTCGGAIHKEIKKHKFPKGKSVVVYDNEPRNPDIVSLMKKAIDAGFPIVVWPKKIDKYGDDINSMVETLVKDGKTVNESVEYIIDVMGKNTYSNEEAILKINMWRK